MRGTEFAEMAAFVAIAERRSFAKAATHLGVARSTLSQNIRALEERLRVRLLNRTTRSVSLTEAGERLLARVRPALRELTTAANELDRSAQGPAGLLRVVVQPPVASFLMGPLLGRFLAKYPGIRLDISVIKMPANIFSEGFDAGIRFGEQVERDMVAMRVMGEARFVVVASPEYTIASRRLGYRSSVAKSRMKSSPESGDLSRLAQALRRARFSDKLSSILLWIASCAPTQTARITDFNPASGADLSRPPIRTPVGGRGCGLRRWCIPRCGTVCTANSSRSCRIGLAIDIMGNRLETRCLRTDGSEFPAEVTVTQIIA